MRKIGILTFQSADNYGAALQCFAMQEYLKCEGNDAKVINYAPEYFDRQYRIYTPFFSTYKLYKKKGLRFSLLRAVKSYARNIELIKKYRKRKSFDNFRRKYFDLTDRCVNHNEFLKVVPEFDAVTVGSDQVWSKRITDGRYDPVFMLQGLNQNIIKMSYAASCGDTFSEDDLNILRPILESYDYLSAREKALANQISEFSGKECKHVCDPVFLLTKEQWKEKLARNNPFSQKKFILAYNVSSAPTSAEYFRLVDKMAEELGCEIYEVGKNRHTKGKGKLFDSVGPQEFIQMIDAAEVVFSTSFHATALSLIFEKQFNVFLPSNAERVKSILEKMNLMNKLISPGDKYNLDSINYEKVAEARTEFVRESLEYLNACLN